jgi:energy-converting hydrogenase B subunit D
VIVASLVPLQATILVLVALAAPAVVLTRDPLRMIVVNGFYGWTLVILFSVFQAPDVALSMLVVGGLAYPLVVLIAIARVRAGRDEKGGK